MVQAGQYVIDGTAVFIVTDVRDGAQVGDIKLSSVLRKGYVKANGALLSSAKTNYPRLVSFVQENPSLLAADDSAWADNKALYVYDDTNDTLRVPDATDRILQGGNTVEIKEAGLPNITGYTGINGAFTATWWADNGYSGAIKPELRGLDTHAIGNVATSNAGLFDTITIDASRSNPIYSNSVTTVQPPAIQLIPQIKY